MGGQQKNQNQNQNQNQVPYKPPHMQAQPQPQRRPSLQDQIDNLVGTVKSLENTVNTSVSSHKTLESQVATLVQLMTKREMGSLPSQPEQNPREQAKVITLRSGKDLNQKNKQDGEVHKEEKEVLEKGK